MIFARETLSDVRAELEPILRRHYEEIAWKRDRIPLDVDWEKYDLCEKNGSLEVYTARIDGKLAGYSAYFISRHPHYKQTIYAQNDVLYIDKPYRGRQGMEFIRWCETQLKARGVQVHGLHVKKWFDWSAMAVRMGFEPMDTILMKWIGD